MPRESVEYTKRDNDVTKKGDRKKPKMNFPFQRLALESGNLGRGKREKQIQLTINYLILWIRITKRQYGRYKNEQDNIFILKKLAIDLANKKQAEITYKLLWSFRWDRETKRKRQREYELKRTFKKFHEEDINM